jgi:short-subunit dehydrogenase
LGKQKLAMNSLKNKVVVITGASSGIGYALAVECAKRGATLSLAARNLEQLQQLKTELESKYESKVICIKTDVSVKTDCEHLIQLTIQSFNKLDILINNAGISMRALFNDCDLQVLENVMNINFWGTVYCTKYALPYILKQEGSIVGVSSIAGYKGLPGRTGYSASKFAMQGFLESLRIENLKNNLHVLIACPGFTASNIRKTALGKDGNAQGESPRSEQNMMSAEDVAVHILNAIEKRKRTIILTTQGKLTVLLNKFFPAWMDKKTYEHMSKEPGSPF